MNNNLTAHYAFCMNNGSFVRCRFTGLRIRGNSRSIKIIENLGSRPLMTNNLFMQHTRLRENQEMKKNAQFSKARFKNSTVQSQTYIIRIHYLVIIQQVSILHELHPFDTCIQTVSVKMMFLAPRSNYLHQNIIS